MALVVKKWYANVTTPDQEGNFVMVECRQEGIVAYILNALGIAPTTTIKVGNERIEFTRGSLEGFDCRLIPLGSICSSYYGYQRPWKAVVGFIAAGIFLGFTIAQSSGFMGFVVAMLMVGGGILYYLLNKKLTLGFIEYSGVSNGIQFKRSVIEGQRIEEDDARRVCTLVQTIIEGRRPAGDGPAYPGRR